MPKAKGKGKATGTGADALGPRYPSYLELSVDSDGNRLMPNDATDVLRLTAVPQHLPPPPSRRRPSRQDATNSLVIVRSGATMHIPGDILSEIFTHAAAGSLLTAIRISHVCSQWRRVALSISRLWDHFDYSLGIWIAQLQMSRVSPHVAISVRISLWDLEWYSRSARKHNTALRSIQWWLLETQIIYFPRWNALHLELSGDAEGETIAGVFDIFNNRDDELDSLVVRVTQGRHAEALPDATLSKLRFRARDFRLDGIVFPIEMLAGPLSQVASLHYEGGTWEDPRLSSVLPPQTPPITLQRLSYVTFHHTDISSLLLNATAPSLTTLYFNNSLPHGRPGAEVPLGLLNQFAPHLQHLQIIDSHSNLLHWMLPQFSLPDLLTLSMEEYYEYSGDGGGLLVQGLINTNIPSTFPKLQKLMLQYVPTPPQVFECLLQSLPASTATVALVECPQSDIIPIDLIRACRNINLSVQLSNDDLDGDWNSDNPEVEWELAQESGSDWSDCDVWSDGQKSTSTFASARGEVRVPISRIERVPSELHLEAKKLK
jgi:hypothetical protein